MQCLCLTSSETNSCPAELCLCPTNPENDRAHYRPAKLRHYRTRYQYDGLETLLCRRHSIYPPLLVIDMSSISLRKLTYQPLLQPSTLWEKLLSPISASSIKAEWRRRIFWADNTPSPRNDHIIKTLSPGIKIVRSTRYMKCYMLFLIPLGRLVAEKLYARFDVSMEHLPSLCYSSR